MKIVLPIRLSILATLCICISTALQAQQLKLGTTPTVIQKSALLELESTKQGLLLTRISDTLSAPLNTALDGTIIYFTPDKSLRVRANGIWQKMGSGVGGVNDYIQNISTGTQTASFSINGSGSIGTTLSLPSLTAGSVLFMNGTSVAQNNANFFWDNTNTRLGILTNAPARKLHVAGDMRLTGSAGTPTNLLGRDATGDISNMAINTTTLSIATGTLTANNNSNIWNANKFQNRNVLDSTPGTGDVLKWSPARSLWLPAPDITGGASYGTLASTDIRNADAPDPQYRMKIWAGPPSAPAAGTVTQGPLGTSAYAWSVLSFQNAAYTTQLYFDKNTLALREWQGNTAPLTPNAGPPANPWYKVVTTLGDNIFTDGGLIFAGKTSDASSEVKQDDANLHWDNTSKELGIGTNNPAASLDVAGDFKLGTSGTVLNNIIKTSVTLNPGNLANNNSAAVTATVTGATVNATVIVNPRASLAAGYIIGTARVSAANTIRVTFTNISGGAVNANGTFDVTIIQ